MPEAGVADAGDLRVGSVAETLVQKFFARDESRFYQATALFMHNRHEEARTIIDALLAAHPRQARAHNPRGVICATKGDRACAIAGSSRR